MGATYGIPQQQPDGHRPGIRRGLGLAIRIIRRGPNANCNDLIDGGLAQQVLGLTRYALVGKTVYGEFGVYRSALQGLAAR